MLARDADMDTLLDEFPAAVGFMGSDRYSEFDRDIQQRLAFCPIAETGIRYALATTQDKEPILTNKLLCPQPLVIATSYKRAAIRAINALRGPGGPLVETVGLGGSVEAAPQMIPRVDAIFDVVDTGNTIAANDLTIVADDLGQLLLGAVWRRDE